MAFDLSSLFWIFIAIMVLQPLFTGRWYALVGLGNCDEVIE